MKKCGSILWVLCAAMLHTSMGCGPLIPVSQAEIAREPGDMRPPAQVPGAPATVEPSPAVVASGPSEDEVPTSPRGLVLANTVMVKSGALVEKALVAELQSQLSPMHACVALIRKTDVNVGSLNLEITVADDGVVTPQLQSPTNAEAERCVTEAARKWRVSGPGSAMVLLMLQDGR